MTYTISTILTVSELTQEVKKKLEPPFRNIRVKGEITNIRYQASGHIYFSLKDQYAQVSAVLFRGTRESISTLPKAGDQIIITGDLTLYAPRGTYQIIVRAVEYSGVGELLLKLHELKEKLQKRGWFDAKHKKPLPLYPKTIGVVTSPTGSVIRDIIHVLNRRFKGFHLILNPVRVQGEGAAVEIAKAINEFNAHHLADLLIVGRGGGSLEALWPFNEEVVAEAIFRSSIPIISAVGHETDVSIADYVADLRAPTPSAAAELSTKELSSQILFLQEVKKRTFRALSQKIREHRYQLEAIRRTSLFASPLALLKDHVQRLDEISSALANAMKQTMLSRKNALALLSSHLTATNPKNVLRKGYCIPFAEKEGSVILSSRELKAQEKLSLLFHDGKVITKVEEVL
jgi:exodeoxyribonuclease VII large subunit